MWTSWFVLAACAVITQSFPRPDEEYRIPDVTLGQRSQYYVLHDDGDFKYGYNTGEGAYESAVQMGSGELTGFYGYNDASGDNVRLDYTAGVGGFVPRSSLLPVAPQVGAAAVRSAGSGFTASGSVAGASGVITKSASPSRSFEEADVRSANNLDGSYSFSYDNSDSSRSESADSSNNVVGQYSFVADDGQNRKIRYKAGSATGYVAEGDSIPVTPEAPTDSSRSSVVALTYSAPQPSVPSGLYVTPVVAFGASERSGQETFNRRGDASYSFNYQSPDSAREESADSDLNVRGKFSFVADDGIQRSVNYIAGSDTGFVAEGDHLPVAPEPTSVPASVSTGASRATVYSGSGISSSSASSSSSVASDIPRDASYSFKYDAGDSSRDETSDNNLNVKGQYSFVADDGVTRTVQYRAGSGTGFVAEGAHLPVPVEEGVASGSGGNHITYSAGSVTGTAQSSGSVSGSSGVASFRGGGVSSAHAFSSDSGVDGSYSFSYTNPDSSRSESADSDLNVRGDYSFVADDGISRQVRYFAGSGTGFVAEGDHLPVPVSDTAAGATSGSSGNQQTYSARAVTGTSQTSGSVSGSSGVASFRGQGVPSAQASSSDSGNDGSYTFAYTNPDSSRSEFADAANNVIGEYSFIADDGQNRHIRYKAGSGTGFVAEGDSIPVAPEVPVVTQGTSSASSGIAVVKSGGVHSFSGYSYQAPTVSFSAPSQAAATRSSSSSASSSSTGHLLGNVLLRQYSVEPGRSKFGYVFTEV